MENKLNNLKDSMMKTVYSDFSFDENNKKDVYKNLRKRKRIFHFTLKSYVSAAALSLLIVGLIGSILFQTGVVSSNLFYEFPGEEQLENNKLLQTYHLPIKLPTYLPFELNDVKVETMYVGEIDLTKDPPETQLDDPKANLRKIVYESTDNKKPKTLEILIHDAATTTFVGAGVNNEKLEDGSEAKYSANENLEGLLWENEGIIYEITLHHGFPKEQEGLLTKNELIEIANSFERFRP
ncbi:hypothetical protein [Bacillus suaedaesalsae]|uniref:DUF4367 domain-containing protein n=1 Tax=Bacillus suaedaesalsae TaxID=2810349 RepID=A0ABS2DJU4_9BACI|nr:hypothetical protein [Bacillus suaedaesalsae]MBM6618767.1 hypothetical protein [Bacillus suaedaesalsae]